MASLASSRVREIEHRSASACNYESSSLALCDDGWKIHRAGDGVGGMEEGYDADGNDLVECRTLAEGTSIRVAPMERACGGWSTDHFHERLRLPENSPPGKGMVIFLEAMARECVAVALSPRAEYELGKTYVVHLGADGNLRSVLRRHVDYTNCVDVAFPSRVCAEDAWVPYWIVLQGGRLSAGVGRAPGKDCVGTLDDAMYEALRSGADAVRHVGLGNSALRRNARDARVRNVIVTSVPARYGAEGIPMEGEKFVNVMEMGYGGGGTAGRTGDGGGSVPTDAELLAEYEKERAKARARAAKFGMEYKDPPPDAFLKWSEARRLRANPERGFITGIDTFSQAEKAKAEARKERFKREQMNERKRKGLMEEDGGDDAANEEGEEGLEDEEEDDVAEWEKTKRDPLPLEQAWENWKLVEQFRVDPPAGLFAVSREDGSGGGEIALSGSFSNDIWHGNGGGDMDGNNVDSNGAETETKEFIPRKISFAPTKIHVFSIDWAPFKQIRTDDLLSYFRDYGPSYVEWLGELSCNVLFEDRHSAERAFRALSRELPSPPPALVGANDDAQPTENAAADGEGAAAMEEAKDGADDVGQGTDKGSADAGEGFKDEQRMEDPPLPDFAKMGWRFCKWTVRKVSNDRHGRRGTRARVLMRLATTADVLDDRPTEWPKPPPGFTTKRVLMPWHDFSGKRRHQNRRNGRDGKRRRRGGGDRRGGRGHDGEEEYAGDGYANGGEHPGLSQGLRSGRSGRSGFSVEELQAERNAKSA